MLLAWWHLGLYALLGACGVNAICFRYARLVLMCSAATVLLCPLMWHAVHWPTPMRMTCLIGLPSFSRPILPPVPDWYLTPARALCEC